MFEQPSQPMHPGYPGGKFLHPEQLPLQTDGWGIGELAQAVIIVAHANAINEMININVHFIIVSLSF